MLLQAASVIRFANESLQVYKTRKNFILVAAYIDDNGRAERYILFQDERNDLAKVEYSVCQRSCSCMLI
jgi:hypothetical protein